jgi:hypothetical protein
VKEVYTSYQGLAIQIKVASFAYCTEGKVMLMLM